MPVISNSNLHRIKLFLLPSIVSSLLVLVFSLSFIIYHTADARYQGSELQQLVYNQQKQRQAELNSRYVAEQSSLTNNKLISNLPLFIFWGGVGLIAYFFVSSIASNIKGAKSFRAELDYVHADRHALLINAAQQLVFRLVILILWVLFTQYTRHVIVPYVIATTRYSAELWNLESVKGIAQAFITLLICLHAHTLFMRALWLRIRLFGYTSYA